MTILGASVKKFHTFASDTQINDQSFQKTRRNMTDHDGSMYVTKKVKTFDP